jgi:hypothetical protein
MVAKSKMIVNGKYVEESHLIRYCPIEKNIKKSIHKITSTQVEIQTWNLPNTNHKC